MRFTNTSEQGAVAAVGEQRPLDVIKRTLYEEELMIRWYTYRGSKYPPMLIEPMHYDRERLAHGGMTPEQRRLRAQWVSDQYLHAEEPVYVENLFQENWYRRMYKEPWNKLFNALKPFLGARRAYLSRKIVPKFAFGLLVFWTAVYQIKYRAQTWESVDGFLVSRKRSAVYPGDPRWPEHLRTLHKSPQEHFDLGFSNRSALRSSNSEY